MNGINRIFILGHLGNEPQIQLAKNGNVYTNLSIATRRSFQKDNERKELTDWHAVRVWGKQAEFCHKYLAKGQPVFVEGYLSSYSRQKENGDSERRTSVQAIRVDFLPRTEKMPLSAEPLPGEDFEDNPVTEEQP